MSESLCQRGWPTPPPVNPSSEIFQCLQLLLHHPSGLQAVQNVPCRREKAVLGHQTRMASGDNCGCMPRKCRMPRIWSNMEQFFSSLNSNNDQQKIRSLNFTKLRIYPISLALISAKYHVSLYRSHIGVICEQVWLLKTLPSGIWNEMQVLKSDEHKNLPPNELKSLGQWFFVMLFKHTTSIATQVRHTNEGSAQVFARHVLWSKQEAHGWRKTTGREM